MVIRRMSSFLILISALLAPDAAWAEDEAPQAIFSYGETCENLGQLSRVELVGISHKTYIEHFSVFCKPDSVYRCDDYNSVLVGLGRLEDNGRGSCRYLPNE